MINSMLLTDGYKLDHRRQYPQGTEYVYSTWIPRSFKWLNDKLGIEIDGAITFGFQHFILNHLIDGFNKNFFSRKKEDVLSEYQEFIDNFMVGNTIGVKHIEELYDLGYLPVEIKALDEGTLCPKGVPMLTIKNTNPKFFWVTNYLETLMSAGLWLASNSATIAYHFKKNLYQVFQDTIGIENAPYINFLVHDFSMRGMSGIDASISSGLGHITCFGGSETLPAIVAAQKYYGAKKTICSTIPASEHSVMCAGSKDNEIDTFKRLITEVYPKGFVSIVSDTWDYWKVITEYLPQLKQTILDRGDDGRVVIRPDSGDPIRIVCGYNPLTLVNVKSDKEELIKKLANEYIENKLWFNEYTDNSDDPDMTEEDIIREKRIVDIIPLDEYNKWHAVYIKTEDDKYLIYNQETDELKEAEEHIVKGSYEMLYDIFGGTEVNGWKVLDGHIGLIYGDSITLQVQEEIYYRLKMKGFAPTNLVLGVGSYTYQNNTRDQLGFAMKATWVQINGVGQEIFKDPKTDSGIKKSLKGLCKVVNDENGNILVKDEQFDDNGGLLKTIFIDGELKVRTTMEEIQGRIDVEVIKNLKKNN